MEKELLDPIAIVQHKEHVDCKTLFDFDNDEDFDWKDYKRNPWLREDKNEKL